MNRRNYLAASGAGLAILTGCSAITGSASTDSDGDGVIDDEDYAPNDPEVRKKSDLVETTAGEDSAPPDSTATPVPNPVANYAWPMFQADIWRTGYRPATTGPTGSVSVKWTKRTDHWVDTTPTVADGTVFAGNVSSGSEGGKCYAVDANSGEEKWVFEAEDSINSSPAYHDGDLFFGSDDGNVYALDAATGDPLWSTPTNDSVETSPAVYQDTVYIGSSDETVYALDRATGNERWTYQTRASILSSPCIVNGLVFAGNRNGKLVALDTETGEAVWTIDGPPFIGDTLSCDGELIYFGGGSTIYAVTASGGETRWTFEAESEVTGTSLADRFIFAVTWEGNLLAVNNDSGEREGVITGLERVTVPPAITRDTIYVGSWDTHIYAFELSSGSLDWKYKTGDVIESSPSVDSGTVYVGSADERIYALE